MLARLQVLITLGWVCLATAWLACFIRQSVVLAMAGFVMVVLGYSAVLGLEMLIMRRVNRGDAVPPATRAQVFRAWLAEVLIAPRIFCWWQPFWAHAVPDQLSPPPTPMPRRRGVVLVHGFFCNRAFWTPWLRRLQADGHVFISLSLEPVLGSIDDYAAQIDSAVQRVNDVTGLPPVLVCHSMGGLAVRAWLRHSRGDARVHHVVTIATPHRGTWLARFGRGQNGQQMRWMSDWQAQLDQDAPPDRYSRFTCWYSNCDNVVFPASSATLPGADNRLVAGKAHVQLAFVPAVMAHTLALLAN